MIFNSPQGIFGNTNAIPQCSSVAFALDECAPDSQVGLITIHAKYKGNPNYLLGTAPLFDSFPQPEELARFAFIAPVVDIPIAIPVAVRTGGDYGLRFTVSDITQFTPIAGARLTFWGFPASPSHDAERFAKGSPGEPAGCPELANASCIATPTPPECSQQSAHRQPDHLHGEALITTLEVQTYQDPDHLSTAQASYPAITECERETFNPVLQASATTDETDAPSGLNIELKAPQFEGLSASPSEMRSAIVTLPPGFTINPDAADGQSACTDAQANFGSEGPAHCPDNSKIGNFAIGSPTLDGPLTGSIYIGEPQPGNQYRLFMVASGFGMNIKLVGSFHTRPADRPADRVLRRSAAASLRNVPAASLCLRQGPDGHADRLHDLHRQRRHVPLERDGGRSDLHPDLRPRLGPPWRRMPRPDPPLQAEPVAGTSNPAAGGFSSFTLKLDREDGDQFLGNLNFTMPPGLTANLHGITYCPEAAISAAAQTLGKVEQVNPSCPASSQIGTCNVAAGPGSHPFHAVGKIYMAGPFQGAPLSLVAITPALAGPYDYGTVVVRVALHIDPTDAHVIADSETVPEIIGGIPMRMREIQVNIDKPNFMINPTNCTPFSVGSEGIGDQGTPAAFSSSFHAVNCVSLPFAPKMKVTQLGGHKATRAPPIPRSASTSIPAQATPTSSRSR